MGRKYFCLARNFKIGIWNGKSFDYTRCEGRYRFKDCEYHWDNGPPFGTVKPLAIIFEEENNVT